MIKLYEKNYNESNNSSENKKSLKEYNFKNSLKGALVDAIEYLIDFDYMFEFPKKEFLANSWKDLLTGVLMGVDDIIDVTNSILLYFRDDIGILKYPTYAIDEFEIGKDLYNRLKKAYDKEIKELNLEYESLNEDLDNDDIIEYDEFKNSSIEKVSKDMGFAELMNNLIRDEYEAIDGYNKAIALAKEMGEDKILNSLLDIQSEEHVHVGQLQELLKLFDINAHKIENGVKEAEEQLSEI